MKTELIAVVSAIVIVVTALGIVKYQEVKIDKQAADIIRLNIALAQADKELIVANDMIVKQNEAIAAMAIDSETAKAEFEAKLDELSTEYVDQKVIIQTELIRDPSCDNELRLVKEQLLLFMEPK